MGHSTIGPLYDMDAHAAQDHLPDHEAELGGQLCQQIALHLCGQVLCEIGLFLGLGLTCKRANSSSSG
jgi:hypothetical protein